MPTWKEQLRVISALRLQRNENDETLYATQIALQKIESELKKIMSGETVPPSDPAAIKDLRELIGQLEKSIRELNIEMTEITKVLGSIKDNAGLISFLEKKILLVTAEIAVVNEQILEAERNRLPDRQKLKELQNRLAQLQKLLASLRQDLAAAKREQALLIRQEQAAKDKKGELDKKRENIKEEIAKQQESLKDKLSSGEQSPDEAGRKKNELEVRYEENKRALDASRLALHDAVTAIYIDPHPRVAVANLNDNIPFLLMPVRIETRFVTTNGNPELWLRIYPDDLVIHTHEKLLTETELSEGEKYWIVLFNAEKNGGPEKEDQKKQAWSNIADLFGGQRSAWIATQTEPTNWNGINNMSDSSQLVFPIHDITKISAWSRAPRAYELPDKFVVMLYEGNTIVKEVPGNIIPDELFLGPDPMKPADAFITVDGLLQFGETFDWTSDFEKAVDVGMGFKIQLSAAQASRGFDKILVLGLNLSVDELGGKRNVEALIDNHHYSTKGFSIVKQGTPTNNTDQDGAGYTSNDPFNNTSYFVETGDPLFAADTDCDGKNLADALGINYEPLQYIQNSNAKDLKEAIAMNKALYPSTLGYYFSNMLKPVLAEPVQDKLRDFFIHHVTGRGALPAIRVGNQPYGILLTSDFSNWQWARNESSEDSQFLAGLQDILNHYSNIWENLLAELMYTGKPGVDPSEVLMNILGLQASSVAFQQRIAYSTDDLKNRAGFKDGERYANDLQKSFDSKNNLLTFFAGLGYTLTDENGNLRVPQLLRLVYQHFHTLLDAANTVDDVPLSENDPIRFYDEAAQKNYIHWLHDASSVPVLEQQDFGDEKNTPKSLLYLQLRRSFLLQLNESTHDWLSNRAIAFEQTLEPVNFHNIRKPDLTKWEVMKGKVGIAVPGHPQKDKSIADHLLTTGSNEAEVAFLNEMKISLELLAGLPTARLERCFTEHLDTCTYRLDAWQSAFFHRRLQNQRRTTTGEGLERGMGIYLGSFGWLEDVRPSNKRRVIERDAVPGELAAAISPLYEYADNGGFVHTPSLNHAMAAAVLRSGYMNHASIEDPDMMAVNLSSERVRKALFILGGIRNGQSLEDLLGYQFERGLHDRGSQSDSLKELNAYIYNFRDAFPIQRHIVQQQGTTSTTETIPANYVVNGLTLAETTGDFPYGATGSVVSANEEQKKAVMEEKDKLADTLDAVKDLLLSESVYQLVQGNFDRCAAVMNAMKDANIPPELEIIDTPRSSLFTFTNRVSIHFEKIDPDPFTTPRARMEGGMNKWLHNILGNMDQLACRVSHTDAEGGTWAEDITVSDMEIQPIDLIYITGTELNTGAIQPNDENRTGASELELRIGYYYRKSNALDDETKVRIEFMKLESPAGKKPLGELLLLLKLLKSLITDSRKLDAEDFAPPSKTSMADNTNPKGYDAEDLVQRVNGALAIFQEYSDKLNDTDIFLNEPAAGINGASKLGNLFTALESAGKNLGDIIFTLQNNNAAILLNTLVLISNFGLPDSFPLVTTAMSDDKKLVLLEQVENVSRRMKTLIQKTTDLLDDANSISDIGRKVEKLIEAGKTLFGDVFNILPFFEYSNAPDIQQSSDHRAELLRYAKEQLKMNFIADEWLQNISHVRPRMARWDSIRTLHELINGGTLDLDPVQLPYRTNDSWVAVEFPAESKPGIPFNIDHDTLSVIIHGDTAFETAGKQSGLLVDEIVEMIPRKDEVTGIAFNYNQPNSVPPQALLLAVAPQEKGNWDWDELVGILNDTLLRAKLRAVEPALLDKSTKPEIGVLLPAILANFSQNDLDLALDYRTNVAFFAENSPVKAVTN